MKKVSKERYLYDRDGVFYYRRRVPLKLVSIIQGKYISKKDHIIGYSLGTSDLTEAKKRRDLANLKWGEQFKKASEALLSGEIYTPTLSREDALKLVRDFIQETDLKFQKDEAKRGLISDEIKRDIEIDLGISEQTLADPSNEEGCR